MLRGKVPGARGAGRVARVHLGRGVHHRGMPISGVGLAAAGPACGHLVQRPLVSCAPPSHSRKARKLPTQKHTKMYGGICDAQRAGQLMEAGRGDVPDPA